MISWILNSASKDISASIKYTTSAHEILMDFKECFRQKNGPKIFQLSRELINLGQGQDSVSTSLNSRLFGKN